MSVPTAIQALFFVLVGVVVVGGSVSIALLLALNQHLRLHHRQAWLQMSALDGPGFISLPVRGFVLSGKFRAVPDGKVHRLATAILWLRRALLVAWVIGVTVLCWFAWVRSAA